MKLYAVYCHLTCAVVAQAVEPPVRTHSMESSQVVGGKTCLLQDVVERATADLAMHWDDLRHR